MPYAATEADASVHVDNILYAPYAYLQFDKDDIEKRLALLTPTNMYAVFTSPIVEKEKKTNPEKFRKEYYYSTEFTVEDLPEETLQRLSSIKPEDSMKLGHAPENVFMPKAEDLINLKAPRANDLAATPKLISRPHYELWFKQDDTFEQPLVKLFCQIHTNSCSFPYSTESCVLAMLWQRVLSEHVRELDYVADLAGITSNFSIQSDHLNFSYISYNDKMEEYLTKVFSQIQNIDVHEEE